MLPPIFEEIEDYTRATFHLVLSPEEIDNLVSSMKFFAMDFESKERPAAVNRAIHRISTLDLHHFGWNIGKRLKKDNAGIAHFLITQFPVVFKNSTEASMKKKLKSEDGRPYVLHDTRRKTRYRQNSPTGVRLPSTLRHRP